ncbi:RNA pseudouridine synthase [Colwellia sp. 39_35_sub15_T18]|nr:RNA pseudouridine synthase [Colwellia sp. 39_35_sub15_T18]
MPTLENCFTLFKQSIADYDLPKRFTFPFCYEPHPLCLLAAHELQQQLQQQLSHHQKLSAEFAQTGKMFGVLLVATEQGDIGYLAAFSGKLFADTPADTLVNKNSINFVPAVVDIEAQTDFFNAESKIINQLNSELEKLLLNPQLVEYQQALTIMFNHQDEQLALHQSQMSLNRQVRKVKRVQAKASLSDDELAACFQQLAKESVFDKNQLRDLKQYWRDLIAQEQQKLTVLTDEINAIKNKRKKLSTRLQKKLFKEYRLLNSAGVEKDVMALFQQAPYPIPPAGTGDCAAPKLLQYAFRHKLKPLAMAEFWWGPAPKSEIRQHKKFYGACSGKCQPILKHMLEGITLDDNPLLVNPALGKILEIVYQDNDMVVVNKPSEFLSVPGKSIEDSVYLRIKQQFPQATGSLIVHRLDMSTSGLMVLALTKRAQKNLQQQFINRTIKKRYEAILEGDIKEILKLEAEQGEINLPLRGDLEDRPRQLVCFEHGKHAKTQWQVIDIIDGKTKLYLQPVTGRTHQLRMHCAHPQGLNMPILGDDLYGHNCVDSHSSDNNTQRLYLHAQRLTLHHPVTKNIMTFEVAADF